MSKLEWKQDGENPNRSDAKIGVLELEYHKDKKVLVLRIPIVAWAVTEVNSQKEAESLGRRTGFFGAVL